MARLADGRWTSFSRAPLSEAGDRYTPPEAEAATTPPTEHPVALGRVGDKVLVFTRRNANQLNGSWDVPMSGHVSLIDLASGKWRTFETLKDFDADELKEMVVEGGEVLVTSNRGLHRFDPAADRWQFLDSGSPILNSTFHTAAVVANELSARLCPAVVRRLWRTGHQPLRRDDGPLVADDARAVGHGLPGAADRRAAGRRRWVLFGDRPYMGAAMRYDFYLREQVRVRPGGSHGCRQVGVSANGPAGPERPPRIMDGVRDDLAAVGNRLAFAMPNAVGGPEPWKAIVQDEEVVRFEPVEGQDAVESSAGCPAKTARRAPSSDAGSTTWSTGNPGSTRPR